MKWKTVFLSGILVVAMVFASIVPLTTTKAVEPEKAVIDAELTKVLLSAEGPVEAIVTFKSDQGVLPGQVKLLEEIGITNGLTLKSLPIAGIVATKTQMDRLAESDQVVSIYLNKRLAYENAEATDLTGVDKVRTDDSMRKRNGGLPVTGKGIGVVINDSGVDGTHQDLEFGKHLVQNVLGSTNLNALSALLPVTYVEGVPNTDSSSGHGTHVAGIVGGTGEMSGGKYEGVAPGANLIGYGSGAAVAMLDILGGFDYALTHQQQYNIRVITNSWGDTGDAGTDFDPSNPINIATKKLYDRGIVTVFSAGNSGPDEKTISGNYKKAPWVVTVAAGDKSGKLADFSSRGEDGRGGTVTVDGKSWEWQDQPTLTSPGVDIISTRVISPLVALGATSDVEYIEPAYLPFYTTMSGTSMAAPHVAGIIALMLEANPVLSPAEVKSILENTATAMPDYADWEVGAGYVNAYNAVNAAFKENDR
ncbi:S8 family serine peptidase [Mesobacillus subterraneus]|uniref:Peptidase S8 n=1 Tax=Mesobacillus subterraneus TaxID=285983 RepID=A0A0D6Z8B5_9BACI|nr:S8 family serine peptidase [Mesobacillus subterraneus]KIY21236.1 peptidase S8 [Mesobacillus subterraneus]